MTGDMSTSNELVKFNDISLVDVPLLRNFQDALTDIVIKSDYVLGEQCALFEQDLKVSEESKFAVGVNSGTSALIIALRALGIGPGDHVITSNLTFAATCFAILEVGAIPILIDINPDTLIMDFESLEKSLTKETKAIIVVTLHGRVEQLDQFYEFSRQNGLKMIIDGAQSQLAKFDNQGLVNFCDLLTLSFYPGKNLGSLGEGGAILGNNEENFETIKLFRNWGMQKKYIATTWGGNYRIENLQAAFLRIKLRKLPELTSLRREKANYYFENLPDRILLKESVDVDSHVYHVYAIKVNDRDKLIERFKLSNIEYGIHYPVPMNQQPYYSEKCQSVGNLLHSELICKEILSIPLHPFISKIHMDRVIDVINEFNQK